MITTKTMNVKIKLTEDERELLFELASTFLRGREFIDDIIDDYLAILLRDAVDNEVAKFGGNFVRHNE